MIKLSIPGQPQGKGRAKVSTYRGYARAYTPEKTAAYENLVKLAFEGSGQDKLTGALKMTVKAVYAIPKSFSRKKREAALKGELRPQTKPDIDNVVKVICDALNGLAYDDDRSITQLHAVQLYGDNPRVDIAIQEVGQ